MHMACPASEGRMIRCACVAQQDVQGVVRAGDYPRGIQVPFALVTDSSGLRQKRTTRCGRAISENGPESTGDGEALSSRNWPRTQGT